MIDFLKRNKFGRATFLPLTSMHGGGGIRNPEALKEPGVIGLANTLVHVESRFDGRRREIEEFEKTVDMLKFDMDELEKEVVEAKNRRAACYSVIDEVQEHLREESVLENTARMNVAQVQREQLESKQRYDIREVGKRTE